ncbi:cytochrome P450 [Stackebrandtia nassauensis]|uniref:Cytochrome P450 n=1 Tax=Stackebrandtia nassauensis (strain DSM 44728 / CIP 108903 / NRRL B-16338 / NBRC 102104 / LLR-40K-21) TaxID=446470 RepID=D3PX77_STANL|nr:cytochrome P450 [Stackebrandtia nassauensis]ADD41340.1 cytochrome P450 [Stackebrandtia nassauensis DSM 44728]
MTHSPTVIPRFPGRRPQGRPLDPPTELAEIRERTPVARMNYPDGHLGWLVTGYHQARALLANPKISTRFELLHHFEHPIGPSPENKAPLGAFHLVDDPEHARFRKPLAGKFTVRRMNLLADQIRQFATERLDAMEHAGSPVDLVEAYAWPIPAHTICELLGVPYSDRAHFKRLAAAVSAPETTLEERYAAFGEMNEYMSTLVQEKKRNPTDDVLSELTTSDLNDEELTGVASFVLGAGLETTAKMLATGTMALLQNPEQLAAWRADPGLTDGAVEELMRYLTLTHTDVRAAVEDVEVDGHVIKTGKSVTISYLAANRDPAKFPDNPEALDLRRDASGHIGFSHGMHQCLGQQLARVEMRIGFPALLERFPTLRLDADPAGLPFVDENVYGVERLPVAWEG